ncbi:hypothetical protein SAMN06265222_108197 [Neorhodopirellula lusitana]|uniref:Uncharacterized protein n=1 Tax=Neorhodopirellula lusitana TaxID=445327 RepID=A0ABY1QAJ0_9BACT|nr:hypothetical protein [Neorhodopirellula lusitana]SMP64254.1 hypothetical protein SAMN06265222_108197 [Neorhodopirellula lusitana]
MSPQNPSAASRTRLLLEDLEAVRENLLALSDDIWLSIDHNDDKALEDGVEFKRAYNAKVASFDSVATELSELVQQYTSVRLDEAEQASGSDHEQNERIIAELDREEPHLLNEDFTYKRPYGFILDGYATTGVTTWQRLYELVCRNLVSRDESRFRSLHDHSDFISNRGHHTVTPDAKSLRKAMRLADGLFVESNLSANSIRDVILRMLDEYEIPLENMKVFLREDRDAEQSG